MKVLKNVGIVFACLLIGGVSGLLGGGGGMICVPLLTYALKFKDKQSHASAILIILATSLVSSVFYLIKGYFDFEINIFAGLGVVVGGIVGALLLKKISNKVLDFIFCLIMLIAGIKLLI